MFNKATAPRKWASAPASCTPSSAKTTSRPRKYKNCINRLPKGTVRPSKSPTYRLSPHPNKTTSASPTKAARQKNPRKPTSPKDSTSSSPRETPSQGRKTKSPKRCPSSKQWTSAIKTSIYTTATQAGWKAGSSKSQRRRNQSTSSTAM